MDLGTPYLTIKLATLTLPHTSYAVLGVRNPLRRVSEREGAILRRRLHIIRVSRPNPPRPAIWL